MLPSKSRHIKLNGELGRCAMGKCCAGYCYDDYTALEGGSAAGRFKPPLAPSSTVVDQQSQTNCVSVKDVSPRGVNWTIAKRLPLLHTFNYPLGSAWGNHMFEVTAADLAEDERKAAEYRRAHRG